MIDPSIPFEHILQAPTRTLAPYSHSAVRALSAAVALVVCAALLAADEPERSAQAVASTSPVGVPGQAGPPGPALERLSGPELAAIVDLQRQVNELRSDLLDERERRIGRLQEANGAVLALVIGVGGLWAYAKFRAIATRPERNPGSARARRSDATRRSWARQRRDASEVGLRGLTASASLIEPTAAVRTANLLPRRLPSEREILLLDGILLNSSVFSSSTTSGTMGDPDKIAFAPI